ncbi:hypothetical protein FA95DRAFT_1668287, partial [Auriscalpium vulgare]
ILGNPQWTSARLMIDSANSGRDDAEPVPRCSSQTTRKQHVVSHLYRGRSTCLLTSLSPIPPPPSPARPPLPPDPQGIKTRPLIQPPRVDSSADSNVDGQACAPHPAQRLGWIYALQVGPECTQSSLLPQPRCLVDPGERREKGDVLKVSEGGDEVLRKRRRVELFDTSARRGDSAQKRRRCGIDPTSAPLLSGKRFRATRGVWYQKIVVYLSAILSRVLRCHAHICWRCLLNFEANHIYNHMRVEHGGIDDDELPQPAGNIEEQAWAQQPQLEPVAIPRFDPLVERPLDVEHYEWQGILQEGFEAERLREEAGLQQHLVFCTGLRNPCGSRVRVPAGTGTGTHCGHP